jgi:ketosteroid isomerase-like protein
MNNAVGNPVIQRNIHTIRAWLDAHNRQDMKALDFYAEDIEIIEMPTGVIYKGMEKMRELARMAYGCKGCKELTNVIATEAEACVEFVAKADMTQPLTQAEKESGPHGVDISKTKSSAAPFAIPVCYICHFTEEGKIDRVREYWDVATMTRCSWPSWRHLRSSPNSLALFFAVYEMSSPPARNPMR